MVKPKVFGEKVPLIMSKEQEKYHNYLKNELFCAYKKITVKDFLLRMHGILKVLSNFLWIPYKSIIQFRAPKDKILVDIIHPYPTEQAVIWVSIDEEKRNSYTC